MVLAGVGGKNGSSKEPAGKDKEWVAACWDVRNSGVCPRGGAPYCNRCSGLGAPAPGSAMATGKSLMQACWDMRNTGVCPRGGAPDCQRCAGSIAPGAGSPGLDPAESWGKGAGKWGPPMLKGSPKGGKSAKGQHFPDSETGGGCWDFRNTGECPRGGAPDCNRCAGVIPPTSMTKGPSLYYATPPPTRHLAADVGTALAGYFPDAHTGGGCWDFRNTGVCPRGGSGGGCNRCAGAVPPTNMGGKGGGPPAPAMWEPSFGKGYGKDYGGKGKGKKGSAWAPYAMW